MVMTPRIQSMAMILMVLLFVPTQINAADETKCGLLNLGIFCPRPGKCGFFRRLFNICRSTEDTTIRLQKACNFLLEPNLINCQAKTSFSSSEIGKLPSEIGLLTQMTRLALSGNQLIGTIPSTLGNLDQLTFLDLSDNQLNGTIPSTLGNLDQLEFLDMGANQLTGTIPMTMGNLDQIMDMRLFQNQLIGTIPTTLGSLKQLTNTVFV
jgi:Leucine rich repeat